MATKFDKLSKLCEEISELESRVRKAAQDEFKPALKETVAVLREFVPQVVGLRWHQFTPSFNDGEPCTFCMGEVEFAYDHGEEGLDYGECYDPVADGVITKEQNEILDDLAEMICGLETASELAFGDDAEITLDIITGELTISEYDCGY